KGDKGDKGEQGIPGTATLSDTEWRKIGLPTGYSTDTGHGLYLRRIGSTVHALVAFQATTAGGNNEIGVAVSGFQPRFNWPLVNAPTASAQLTRSEEHTSELQSRENLVCRLLLEKKKNTSMSVKL